MARDYYPVILKQKFRSNLCMYANYMTHQYEHNSKKILSVPNS